MGHLSKAALNQIRITLEADKAKSESEIADLFAQDPRQQDDHASDNADSGNEAAEVEGHERIQALIEQLQRKVSAIDEALFAINDGTYGHCATCGIAIDEKRLMIMPTATQCVKCEEKARK